MKLPKLDINPEKIETLEEAKELISQLLNAFEELSAQTIKLYNKNQELEQEIRRLKKQSPKPKIKGGRKYSSKIYASKNKNKKSSKKLLIDRSEKLPEISICECGSKKFKSIRTWDKLVQGIIIKRDNVKYCGRDKQCKKCDKVHSSILPNGIAGQQFSPELKSWLSIFKYQGRMTERVISKFLSGIGIQISTGHINTTILENSNKLVSGYTHLKVWGIKNSSYLHSDATGLTKQVMTTGNRLKHHLNFIGHEYLSLFKITSRYNSQSLTTKVLGGRAMEKLYISDDASPNGKKLNIENKQICWVHEIRHYYKLTPTIKTHRQKLDKTIDQLWKFYEQIKNYAQNPTLEKRNKIEKTFIEITGKTTSYKDLDKRLKMTLKKQSRLLCFLDYPGLPIQNNLAERDLRPAVIIRKISGGTKSTLGEKSFERHLSIVQTAYKQNLNIFNTIHGLIMGTFDPFLLTQKTTPNLARL